jgi:predicted CxxxxCH...CXXCH cytochrome family protein
MNVSRTISGTAAILAAAVCLWGCGTSNSDAPSLDTAGRHPAGWVVVNGGNHRLAFRATPDQCPKCHGSDYLVPGSKGGIAKVSCSSTSFSGIICHANGHVPRSAPHALPFTDPALHGPAAKADLKFCQGCHSSTPAGGPGSNSRFNAKIGALFNGCEDCHNFLTAHPSSPLPDNAPWRGPFSHKDAGNPGNACALCHGANLNGRAEGGIGPACISCHLTSPLVNVNCTSCHGSPLADATPGLPAGTLFPNIQGAHDVHDALDKVTGVCSSCHTGAGIGTLNHFNRGVNVALATAYTAKTGGLAHYSSAVGSLTDPNNAGGRCLNVSCHGGQTTPPWRTGAINPDVDCTSCHQSKAVSDQFNSYFSGSPTLGFPSLHEFHLNALGLSCIDCHDSAKLAPTHFVGLDTPQFEGVPAASTRDAIHYAAGTCTPDPAGPFTVNFGCHATRSWIGQ